MNNALGQYGIGGRLGDSIRERQGMAYYVFSSFDANVVEGPLIVRAGVNPANVDRADCLDRRRDAPDGGRRADARRARRLQAVSDRIDSAAARNQRRHRHVPADGGVLRAGARPRPPASVAPRCGHARRRERRRARGARREPRRASSSPGRISDELPTKAVFFDVDFTLIYPGPAFQGEGYRAFCARHGMEVDPARFPAAVISASHILDREQDAVYDPQIFIDYTAHIIRAMGGAGAAVEPCAAEIYRGMGVVPALSALRRRAGGARGARGRETFGSG